MDLTKLAVTNVALCIYLGAFQKAWKPTLVGSRAPTDLVLLQPPNRERENHVGTSWILSFLDRTGRRWCAQKDERTRWLPNLWKPHSKVRPLKGKWERCGGHWQIKVLVAFDLPCETASRDEHKMSPNPRTGPTSLSSTAKRWRSGKSKKRMKNKEWVRENQERKRNVLSSRMKRNASVSGNATKISILTKTK